MGGGEIAGEEVAKHSSRESCWIIVHGKQTTSFGELRTFSSTITGNVYDVTEFLDGEHVFHNNVENIYFHS
jgi:hypothetical protein